MGFLGGSLLSPDWVLFAQVFRQLIFSPPGRRMILSAKVLVGVASSWPVWRDYLSVLCESLPAFPVFFQWCGSQYFQCFSGDVFPLKFFCYPRKLGVPSFLPDNSSAFLPHLRGTFPGLGVFEHLGGLRSRCPGGWGHLRSGCGCQFPHSPSFAEVPSLWGFFMTLLRHLVLQLPAAWRTVGVCVSSMA